jgi:hypothetical protein
MITVIAYSFTLPIASCKYIIGSGTGFKKYKIKAMTSISIPVSDKTFKFASFGLNISSSIPLFKFILILKNLCAKLTELFSCSSTLLRTFCAI